MYQTSNSAKHGMKGTFKALTKRTGENPGIYYNLGQVDGDVYGTWAHEMSHWSDTALPKKPQIGIIV